MVSQVNSRDIGVVCKNVTKKTCVLTCMLVFGVTLLTLLGPKTHGILAETNYIVEKYEYSCFNSSILTIEANSTNGSAWQYFAYNITCPNGCEDNLNKYGADCVEPSYILTMEVIAGIIILFIILVWAGRKR